MAASTRIPPRSLWTVAIVLAALGCTPEPPPQNLLFVSLDTTRKDHLSVYGYERETTPAIDELARRGAVFDNGVAQMTITNPSHASMFSGLYPKTHGVGENTRELGDEFLTLTEILRAVGFRTGGFVSGHPLKPTITGIDQGFETYDGELRRRRDGAETTGRALEWLRGVGPDERFFLFVHLYDAHGPYRVRSSYRRLFRAPEPGPRLKPIPIYQQLHGADGERLVHLNDYVDHYDTVIRYQDDQVRALLDAVDLERTVVAIVADHGETLTDRESRFNLSHGTTLFDEQISIPFILYSPAIGAGRYPQTAETVDLLPTLLDLLGLAVPPGLRLEGESLLPVLEGRSDRAQRELAFSSNRQRLDSWPERGYNLRKGAFSHSVRTRRWKLILYTGDEQDYVELYNLEDDPAERTNVADLYPEQRDSLLEALAAWRTAEPSAEPDATVAPEDLEDLRALGYVGP